MAVTKIKALDQFSHGRLSMAAGDTDMIELVEARELAKAGLVKIDDDTPALVPEPELAPAAGDTDMIEGGAKMADEPENKMADAPMNKTNKPKAK
ncbi:hypothetical protein [Massilia rubra]|uniref:Mu-like prophage FluMu N-terminal domain-containing protein n=1 Tax=Massilia rubra TaxID=2607910 RepID=A0ABX0LUZ1_9BURK|nr:hypothetical protein [Massilia rubra]NHZ38337.1 hypothetical protein [Massilia rubra]